MLTTAEIFEGSRQYLMNTYARFPVALVRGQGMRVWDSDGKEYLDFVAGIAVDALGHCHPKVVAAIKDQAERLLHVSNIYHIEPQVRLGQLLVKHSFADRAFFCNSGAEANEAAIKLARKYAKDHWASDRFEIVTMENSFHGRTLATVTATVQPKYQHGFEPLVPGFKYIPFNDLRAAERAVDNRTCAILVEPVQGEGGVNPGSPEYLRGLRRLCDATGALLIFDEVQTGLGRTGRLFAHEHAGVAPDMMTLAKPLAGGLPMGALLASEAVAASFTPGTHASTFAGNPFCSAVAVAAVSAIIEEGLPENAARVGAVLVERLRQVQAKFPVIKEVRGLGLLLGLEMTIEAKPVIARCMDKGLLVLSAGERVLRMVPPLIVTEAEAGRAAEIVAEALAEVAK
jgi:predicted acetylornithine/succinylornithine family transaminase